MRYPQTLLALPGLLLLLSGVSAAAANDIDYEKEIYPLLARRCFECHGPEKQKGKLRLDQRDGLFSGDEDFIPVVAGHADRSYLIERVSLPADDPDIMPPKGEPLSAAEVELLRTWISEGASWKAIETELPPGEAERRALELPALTAEQAAARDAALGALREAGFQPLPVAQGMEAYELNLSLRREPVTDADLALLSGLEPVLVRLDLARTAVTDAGLEQLVRFGELRHVSLARTAVGDAGVARLAALTKLDTLNLYGTKVGDGSLPSLASMPGLRRVYLWQTAVSDAGVAGFAESAPGVRVQRGATLEPVSPPEEKAETVANVINEKCPVSGEAVDAGVFSLFEEQKVGFCCTNCKGAFDKDPAKFAGKIEGLKPAEEQAAAPVNAKCPVSGQAIDPATFSEFEGQRVAFCCTKCKGAFDKDPAKFAGKIEGLKPAEEQAAAPVNAKCPVSGQAIDPAAFSEFEGQRVAFCCTKCKAAFDKDPSKFSGKIPELKDSKVGQASLRIEDAVQAQCPFSGRPIEAGSLTLYEGKVVGFCNPDCRDKFAADPSAFLDKIPALGE